MSKPYTPENLPDEYPIDQGLLIEAASAVGIDIHARNHMTSDLEYWAKEFARTKEARYWFKCVGCERMLRGLIAEAKIARFGIIKPHHDPKTFTQQ